MTKNIKKAKILRSRNLVELQFQVFKALHENHTKCKFRKAIISHCLETYSARLLRAAVVGLSENVKT